MSKKEWIWFFITTISSFTILFSVADYKGVPIWFIISLLLTITLALLFLVGKGKAQQKTGFILITHLLLTSLLMFFFYFIALRILNIFNHEGIKPLAIALLLTFIGTLGSLFLILFLFNKFIIKTQYMTNVRLQRLKDISSFTTFIITIVLLINTTLAATNNTMLSNYSNSISKLEVYFASENRISSKAKYSYTKDGQKSIKYHISVIENYIIGTKDKNNNKKVSFQEYLINNQIKLSKISTSDKDLANRITNIENYLMSNEDTLSFVSYSLKNGNSIFTPKDSNDTYPMDDYYYLFLTIIIYVLASYYLLIPLEKEKEEDTDHTNNTDLAIRFNLLESAEIAALLEAKHKHIASYGDNSENLSKTQDTPK